MNHPNSDSLTTNEIAIRPLRVISPLHAANRRCAIHVEGLMNGLGVTAAEAHLISYLHVYGERAVGDLIRVFGTKRPTMTSLLDRLVERGLVVRGVNPDDRRSFVVDVTPAGAEIGAAARERVERFEKEIRKRLAPEDLRGLENVAKAVADVTGVELDGSRSTQPRRGGRNGT